MNPLLTQTSSSFLTLNQLSPHCNKLLNLLQDARTNNKDKILFEQKLWNEVKKIRPLNDESIYLYLIGFYHSLLYQIDKATCKEDELFHYHVLIRLGDLNRYMDCLDVAEYYYCSARNAFPNFGHAYNQLGLLTKPTNCYKCCYYYARSAKSIEKPLNTIAESNLRIAITNYDCKLLDHILNNSKTIDASSPIEDNYRLPDTALEWFYVIVIAIYADNIQPITKLFLSHINENFSLKKATNSKENMNSITDYCDRNFYILMADLDIMLDWLKLGSQAKTILSIVSNELCQIKSNIQDIIKLCDLDSLSDSIHDNWNTSHNRASPSIGRSNSSSLTMHDSMNSSMSPNISNPKQSPALPHDYVLRGFSPLEDTQKNLTFEARAKSSDGLSSGSDRFKSGLYLDTQQLRQILQRLKQKLNAFGLQIIRQRTRNIALESILSNMEKNM